VGLEFASEWDDFWLWADTLVSKTDNIDFFAPIFALLLTGYPSPAIVVAIVVSVVYIGIADGLFFETEGENFFSSVGFSPSSTVDTNGDVILSCWLRFVVAEVVGDVTFCCLEELLLPEEEEKFRNIFGFGVSAPGLITRRLRDEAE